jgi:hypothetical protein
MERRPLKDLVLKWRLRGNVAVDSRVHVWTGVSDGLISAVLGAAVLTVALKRRWVIQDLDCRALAVTSLGRREMLTRFGLRI